MDFIIICMILVLAFFFSTLHQDEHKDDHLHPNDKPHKPSNDKTEGDN